MLRMKGLLFILISISLSSILGYNVDGAQRHGKIFQNSRWRRSQLSPWTKRSRESEEGGIGTSKPSRFWLEIDQPPVERQTAKKEGVVVLECQAIGSPPPTIIWLKNGSPIRDTNMEDSNKVEMMHGRFSPIHILLMKNNGGPPMAKVKSKLQLPCLTSLDEAEYTCVAENEAEQLIASAIVYVSDGPKLISRDCESGGRYGKKRGERVSSAFIANSQTIHMDVIGNDVMLPCRAGGFPTPSVQWLDTQGREILGGKRYEMRGNGDLIIRNISWTDMGDFTCKVTNAFGSDLTATFLYPLLNDEET